MFGFEWDPDKAQRNLKKHDVSFREAMTVFRDPLARIIADPLHSTEEERFVIVGASDKNRLLVVVFTERGDNVRIISARRTTRMERKNYEENQDG